MARRKTKKRALKSIKSRRNRLFLPYPLLLFVLLCVGVFLVGWTLKASGDDVHVTAAVHAPPVTSPAVITNPSSGKHFNSIPISVSGNCPSGAAYVEIYRNGLMSGSAICDAGGHFQLLTDLFPGRNDLQTHVFNSTDDQGPDSAVVTVYYDRPSPPAGTPSQPGSSGSTPSQESVPVISTAFLYKGYFVGQKVVWPLEISGGQGPYAVAVDWGDGGTKDLLSRKQEGQFDISHIYRQAGGYKGSYTVNVDLADYMGNTAHMQFFVIINARQPVAPGSIYNKPTPSLGTTTWLWYAWPAYALVLLMVLSYWLGEREEIISLKKHGLLRR